jgi:hypothetical protein
MGAEKRILNTQDGSIDMINSLMDYDKIKAIGEFSEKMSGINEPKMLVSEKCPNMIFALKNWTGEDGLHGACKDPIDILRGWVLSRLGYVGPELFEVRGGSAGY